MNIETTTNGQIAVHAPYNKRFIEFAHETAGKWNASDKAWMFDERDRSKVEDICVKLFNYLKSGDKTVTIQFPGTLLKSDGNEEFLLGKKMCYRPSRDSQVRLTDGLLLISGKFAYSGGSMRYPNCGDVNNLVFEYRNFPESRLPELDEIAYKDDETETYWYKVIENPIDLEALRSEKEALLKRLEEIDKLLNL